MINNLIDGISIKINQVFGNEYKIYSEDVKQGLNEPCFFIFTLNPSNNQMLGLRSFRITPFDIHYFPKNKKESNLEMQEVASKLYEALDMITLINGDKVRGTNMNHEVVDDVLHFFVNYNVFVKKIEEPKDSMEDLEISSGVKG